MATKNFSDPAVWASFLSTKGLPFETPPPPRSEYEWALPELREGVVTRWVLSGGQSWTERFANQNDDLRRYCATFVHATDHVAND